MIYLIAIVSFAIGFVLGAKAAGAGIAKHLTRAEAIDLLRKLR